MPRRGERAPRIVAFATQGTNSRDERRLRELLEGFDVSFAPVWRGRGRLRTAARLIREISHRRPDLVVMEGTGIGGGIAVLASHCLSRAPYVVGTGDAVGPFVGSHQPLLGPSFAVYERALYRFSAGVVGWTPYLAGRAITYGAPRAISVPGWAPPPLSGPERSASRRSVSRVLGIPEEAIVVGLVGSLVWNRRVGYCYGLELVRAATRLRRDDVAVLVVGGGSGEKYLKSAAGRSLGKSVFVVGAAPHEAMPRYLAAMDIASLPQSVDGVGSFRYSAKLPEYLAARLPEITGRIPAAYDLDTGWVWRLPGRGPWNEVYVSALADLLSRVTEDEISEKQAAIASAAQFHRPTQVARMADFLGDLTDDLKDGLR